MIPKGRFSLLELLTVVAAISFSLGLVTSSNRSVWTLGFFLLVPVLLGCANYLWCGRQRMEWGLLIGMLLLAALFAAIARLVEPV
jgi:hypothetical protein